MSSSEETYDDRDKTRAKTNKKRRMRACDMCRRRKVRCDGGIMPGNICSNCTTLKYKCTYVEAPSKRLIDAGYLESLETQLTEMRKTLKKYRQICPDVDLEADTNGTPIDAQSPFAASSSEVSSPTQDPHQIRAMSVNHVLRPPVPSLSDEVDDLDPSDDEVNTHNAFADVFQEMSLHPKHHHDHFLGKSSGMMLVQTAMEMRKDYEVVERERVGAGAQAGAGAPRPFGDKRPMFWTEYPWVERRNARKSFHLEFPDPDLINDLVTTYFTIPNLYLPLLHRPTFEKSVREGLHRRDSYFGCVLLLVCALGAQYSDDPRVLLDGAWPSGLTQEEKERFKKWRWHSAGWKWFLQVQDYKNLLNLAEHKLADLQILCLATLFTLPSPHSAWGFIGVGIRYALELGAHRRKVYSHLPSVESELLKRAFWLLVYLDRTTCSSLGRPCALQDEDIDVDLPVACDDEYWTNPDPNLAFKQPEGKPSTVCFFNCALRLTQIHAFALRTIYSINKSKSLLGLVGPQWEQHIVAELDSTMNRWIDSVPDHLRWNPHMENLTFLSQSALLYASYYALQIVVHRPFIPSPRKPSGISFPSLAICTNAARSCVHVLDVHAKRTGCPSPLSQLALFSAGTVLLVNIWGAKRSGSIADPVKEMKEVHKAMEILKTLEKRWYSAGTVGDILYNLANVGDLPLPEPNVRASQKRTRSSDDVMEPLQTSANGVAAVTEARQIAGTRRVQQYQQSTSSSSGLGSFMTPGDFDYPLPIHGDELGRIPLHPFLDSSMSAGSNVASSSSQQPTHETAWLPDSFGAISDPFPHPESLSAGARASGAPLDATSFETIFSMLPPASYQPAEAHDLQNAVGPYPQTLTSLLSENVESLIGQTGAPGGQEPVMQNSLDDGALAMWSNAPTGFEWDDWSSYVNTFGSGL